MTERASTLQCAGCGWMPAEEDLFPFRCVNAGSDDVDHVVARMLDLGRLSWPDGGEENPFVRYRTLSHAYHVALARGMSDADYVDLVERLDKEVAAVDGRGFVESPFGRADRLSDELRFTSDGGVWVKDETGNVSGSHKARHLMGVMIYLQIAEETGLADPNDRPDLAIASCGNAALAAAVVARAAGRRLRVFVPTWADAPVVDRLRTLGAVIEACERTSDVPGDPTYHALHGAIAGGALPFTCQGNENGLSIEGGQTLGYEIADAVRAAGVTLDRVFVQVGGGALASAVIGAFTEARDLGALDGMPRFHAVQTSGVHPLKRAYDLVRARATSSNVDEALAYAARHRSEFMWPWEQEPKSIAHGILDDETYDWLAVVKGMIGVGGHPVVVDEDTMVRAYDLAHETTGIGADHTGTAGLAGLVELMNREALDVDDNVAVLFTGARRETREGDRTQ